MKNLSYLFLLSMLFVVTTAQAQNYDTTSGNNYGPDGESGKCYAQCLIPGDTVKTNETIEIKPGYKVPHVVEGYPRKETVTYTVKEKCSTCEVSEKKSTKTKEKIVVVKPGYWTYSTTPAIYETVYDSVLIKEECISYEIYDPKFKDDYVECSISGEKEIGICTPAVLGSETRTVEIEEACVEVEVAPYIFEEEDFEIEVAGPTKQWVKQKSYENCLSANPDDCLVWCLIDIPGEKQKCTRKVKKGCPYGFEDNGEYCIKRTPTPPKNKEYNVITCEEEARFDKDVVKIEDKERIDIVVLDEPGGFIKRVDEAIYEVIERKVVVRPATIDSIYVEPEIDTITLSIEETRVTGVITETPPVEESCERLLCTEPEVKTDDHKPEYKTVTKIEIKKGNFTEWQEVVCPADLDGYTIGLIQQALRQQGYDPGQEDSLIGEKTKAALTQYQKDNNLPIGQLDLKTLEALGIRN